jgi:O-antigen/teichoic acid export membrane protein
MLLKFYGVEKFSLDRGESPYQYKEILRYSINFQGIRILSTFRNFAPLILIGKLIDPVQVAKFSISTRLTQLGPTIFSKFSVMFFPTISKYISDEKIDEAQRIFITLTKVMIRGGIFLGIILFYCSKYFVTFWVGVDKYAGNSVLALVIVFMIANIGLGLFGITVFSNKKFRKWAIYGYLEIVFAIILASYLSNFFGLFGLLLGLYLAAIPSQVYLYIIVCDYYKLNKKLFILNVANYGIKSNIILISIIITMFILNIYPTDWIELVLIAFGLILSNLIIVIIKFYKNPKMEFTDRLLKALE